MGIKIIFLDIDGVLNNDSTQEQNNGVMGVDPKNLAFLKQIVDATGAEIVLTSDWRYGWFERDLDGTDGNVADFNYLEKTLNEVGLHFFSKTPIDIYHLRGREIKTWLEKWGGEPVDKFVIIDDLIDDISNEPELKGHIILTSSKKGLRRGSANMAIQMLGKKGE